MSKDNKIQKNMKTFKLVGMALLAVVMSISFIACSSDNDDNKETATSLSGTTWKVVSVDNDEDSKDWIGSTATFNADGTVTFKPANGWTYTRWTLNGNTLKIVVGEGHADDYMEGTLSISGNSGTYDFYWADVDGKWTGKDDTHAIVHIQKQ